MSLDYSGKKMKSHRKLYGSSVYPYHTKFMIHTTGAYLGFILSEAEDNYQ